MKNRFYYLDILRVLACFLVVGVHVSASNMSALPVQSFAFGVTWGYDWLSLLGVPMFAMISGALLLRPEYKATPKTMLPKALHFVLLYYIWRIFYQVYTITAGFFSWQHFYEYVIALPTTHYHLWFLAMIAVIYLTLPIVKPALENDRKLTFYFLSLFFVLGIMLPYLAEFPGTFFTILKGYLSLWNFELFAGYMGYFVLGHALHSYSDDLTRARRTVLYALGVLSLLIAVGGGYLLAGKEGIAQSFMNSPLSPTSFFAAAALFVLVKQLFGNRESGSRVFSEIGKLTLGVYLLHPFIMERAIDHGITTEFVTPFISVPVLTIAVFLISLAIIFILTKIPVLRYVALPAPHFQKTGKTKSD